MLAGAAQGPGLDTPITVQPTPAVALPLATLTLQGNDVVITGSVAMLFNTGSFTGPNGPRRSTAPGSTPDGVTVSSGFDAIRAQLAAARAPQGQRRCRRRDRPDDLARRRPRHLDQARRHAVDDIQTGSIGDKPDGTPVKVASLDRPIRRSRTVRSAPSTRSCRCRRCR